MDWTFASNNVEVYLMNGACNSVADFNARVCSINTFSESATLKPERLRVLGANAGAYTLGIGNRGPADESVSYQVVLTTGGLRGQ